ncbi:MAG: hypothetical protein IJX88_03525 [Clostridia bacterium]|nr:hypothetical protein [Clostridia bacterium]
MKKISSYEIALSALSAAIATIFLTVGIYTEILLFTGYLFASIAMMLPLAKRCFWGYILSYTATCLLSLLFVSWRFWDMLPFALFFGLHPLINELQLKSKINRWVACAVKALWFDTVMYLVWRFIFGMTTSIPALDKYMVWIIVIVGTLFFGFYDNLAYRCRGVVNTTVARIERKK